MSDEGITDLEELDQIDLENFDDLEDTENNFVKPCVYFPDRPCESTEVLDAIRSGVSFEKARVVLDNACAECELLTETMDNLG